MLKKQGCRTMSHEVNTSIIKAQFYNRFTEAEILRRGGKNTQEELYKKDFNDPDSHNGVITHLQPEVLECKVKWALGSITTKLVKVMEFQLSFKS